MKPLFLTITGIDDQTDLNRVVALSIKYPVEWGVLFTGNNYQKPRYPNNIKRIIDIDVPIFSAHLCGKYAEYSMSDNMHYSVSIGGHNIFRRVQINSTNYDLDHVKNFQTKIDKPVIVQVRGEFPETSTNGVYSLHDTSGGKGITPSVRPVQKATNGFVGYAGGIGPHNVLEVLDSLDAVDKYFWIDGETHFRTDDWLDLDKCEETCRLIWG